MYINLKKIKRKLGKYDHYFYYSLEKMSNYCWKKYKKSKNDYMPYRRDFKSIMMERLNYSICFIHYLHQLAEEQLKGVFTLSQLAFMASAFDHIYIYDDFPLLELKEDLFNYIDHFSPEDFDSGSIKYLSVDHILTCADDLGDISEFKRVINSVSVIDLAVLFNVIIELRRTPDDSENISLKALFNRLKK